MAELISGVFRPADFLPDNSLIQSESSSPSSGSPGLLLLLGAPAQQQPSPPKAVRVGSRLRRSLKLRQSACKAGDAVAADGGGGGRGSPAIESGDCGDGGQESPAAREEQVDALQPQPGGPSPTARQPDADDALGWVEDSCRDVCELSPPTGEAAAASEGAEAMGSLPGASQQVASLEDQQPEQDREQQPQCMPASGRGLGEQGAQPSDSLSTHQHSPFTPLERPFTAVSEAPSSTGLRDARLLQQVDLLTAKLAAEAEARRVLQAQLGEQRRESEAARQRLEATYEAKFEELRQQLHSTATAGYGGSALQERVLSGSSEVRLSGGELDALRKEMAEQEMLLRAYQAENELAVLRIKQDRTTHRQELEAAQAEVERLQRALAQQQEAAAAAAAQPASPPGAGAARLQEVLSLQSQLEAAQAAAHGREQELHQQLAAAREEKRDLQAQMEALRAGQAQGQTQVVRRLEMEMQALRLHAADTQAKLQWYAENHAQGEQLIQQQASMIVQLEQQLLSPARPAATTVTTSKVLAELERENASLKAQLAAAAAAGPSGGRAATLAEALQQKLVQLERAMAERESEGERRARALRQECEKMRAENAKRSSINKATTARLKEMEQQLEEVRSSARKKVQALELKVKAAEAKAAHAGLGQQPLSKPSPRPAKPPLTAGAATTGSSHGDTGSHKQEQRLRKLEAEVQRRDAQLAALQNRAAAADDLVNQAAAREQETAATLRSLQQALAEAAAGNEALRSQLRELEGLKEEAASRDTTEARMAELQRRAEAAETAMAAARQAQAEATALKASQLAELHALREQHSQALTAAQRVGEQLAAAGWQIKLAAAERVGEELQQRVRSLEGSLSDARAGIPWTPKAAEFAALERKLGELEAQQAQREAAWRRLVEEQAQRSAAQGEALRQRYELALAAKEGQLGGFRQELDGLLAAARVLQQQGPRGQQAAQLPYHGH